jgi:AcrR family transcriptional regulator
VGAKGLRPGGRGAEGSLGGFDGADGSRVLGREGVAELQRARIVAAMSELVSERGVGGVTVAHVVTRSGVSRRTFYELFEDREECLLATFEHAVTCAAAAVLPAYKTARRNAGGWEEQTRAALAALLRFLDAEPALGRLLVVDALAAEQRVLEHRARVLDALVDALQRGARAHERAAAHSPTAARIAKASASPNPSASRPRRTPPPARIVAEGAVGAVLAVIHARLLERSPRPLSGLLNPLMGIIVLPYLGPAAAARQLERPAPRVPKRSPASTDPLRGLDMRLTYRTVRVLLAISELHRPGSQPSGRQVAEASGISDQGQMSKLLARLQHLGLIRNDATARGKGGPNAWTLTPKGRDVEQAIRAQTSG